MSQVEFVYHHEFCGLCACLLPFGGGGCSMGICKLIFWDFLVIFGLNFN
jgi:uncharacterized membrane protein YtjA (UPF0391 family)